MHNSHSKTVQNQGFCKIHKEILSTKDPFWKAKPYI